MLIAALAELIATITGRLYWRTVAVANVRVGAAFGVIAATAGWFLPRVLGLDSSALLEWHRWLGTLGDGLLLPLVEPADQRGQQTMRRARRESL